MGIMDLINNIGGDLLTPPQSSAVETGRNPLQMMMARPEVQVSQPRGTVMSTTMPSGMIATASTTPQVQQQFAMPQSGGMPTPPQATPARPQMPDMGGAGVRLPPEQLAEQAAKAVDIERRNPDVKSDPGFMSSVKNFFGNRENMLRLAAGFNSMRLNPDQGLASLIGTELQDIRKTKASGRTAQEIVRFLRAKGYEEYAKIAEANPEIARDIYSEVIQKELDPGASVKTSGVQTASDGRLFVVTSDDQGNQEVKFLPGADGRQLMGTTPRDRAEAEVMSAREKGNIEAAQTYVQETYKEASNLGDKLNLYQDAIVELERGAGTGVVQSLLPTVRAATANLESIRNQLGITVINSATFGALSESELNLALNTDLPLNLPEDQLAQYLKNKMDATIKLRAEMLKKAADMQRLGYNEFITQQRKEVEENSKFLTPPAGVEMGIWRDMTLAEKKRFMELGD
jgi:hypothetical protein